MPTRAATGKSFHVLLASFELEGEGEAEVVLDDEEVEEPKADEDLSVIVAVLDESELPLLLLLPVSEAEAEFDAVALPVLGPPEDTAEDPRLLRPESGEPCMSSPDLYVLSMTLATSTLETPSCPTESRSIETGQDGSFSIGNHRDVKNVPPQAYAGTLLTARRSSGSGCHQTEGCAD